MRSMVSWASFRMFFMGNKKKSDNQIDCRFL